VKGSTLIADDEFLAADADGKSEEMMMRQRFLFMRWVGIRGWKI